MAKSCNMISILCAITSCLVYSLLMHPAVVAASTLHINVVKYGAKPDGRTDSTEAFARAWDVACTASDIATVILVPKGRYLMKPITFKGECASPDITFQMDGTLVAPQDYKVLGGAATWLAFHQVSGVTILGGALDARGAPLWACKASSKNCPAGATSLSITNSINVRVQGLLSLNSQMFHIVINRCQHVVVNGVRVIAAGNSPNTDGFHVQQSQNVQIINSTIKTGDDCISIGQGTKNLWVQGVRCGPGHGISIGSLAKEAQEEGVENVTVMGTIFSKTTNGLRIKSWARPSNGSIQSVHFINAVMNNVKNPIIIDQNYCPHNINCPNSLSGIKINDVVYKDVRGTSATPVAVKFDCSAKVPCRGITMENVNLKYLNKETPDQFKVTLAKAQSFCANVIGKAVGFIQPDSCL